VGGENETLRWPTNLDRAGIEQRLAQAREAAKAAGLDQLVALLAGVEAKNAGQLATAVVSSLTWLQDKPEQRAITMQLEMVALNLKNLKG
jgi:hydroxypyruvate isomerase